MEATLFSRERRTYLAEAASAGAARRFASGALAQPGTDTSDAVLVVGELAANAAVHARGTFEVLLQRTAERQVRIEVVNDAPEMLAAMRSPSPGSGRGLHIVDALAARWGTESRGATKVVWAEVDLPPSP